MQRRQFLAASLAASTTALAAQTASHSPTSAAPIPPREFYHLRRFTLQTGPQTGLAEHFFGDALIPALGRLHLGPIGAFKLDIGPETPTFYLLIPGIDPAALALLDTQLAQDEAFLRAAEPFWAAPATSPAFHRVDSSLLLAFEGWPKLTAPAAAATRAKRLFQLRTLRKPQPRRPRS